MLVEVNFAFRLISGLGKETIVQFNTKEELKWMRNSKEKKRIGN